MPKKRFSNYYYFSSLFFAVAFIVVLTIKMIFAWNIPANIPPNPAGQTLFSDANHNIGIGTLSPTSKMEIFSTSSDSILELSRGPSSTTSTILKIGTDSAFVIQNQSTDMFAIKNGNVGIGTASPNDKLTIEGGISVKELNSAPSETSGYGKIYAIGGSGGIDSYTKLLLHADGTGASFTDSSGNGKTITANGNATQSSTQSKFGGSSAYFDGMGDFLHMNGSSDFVFDGDFTMDVWINTTYTGIQKIWGTSNESVWTIDGWHWGYQNGNFIMEYNGVGAPQYVYSVGNLNDGSWHHLALVRSGSTMHIFADGVQKASFTYSGTLGNATFRTVVGTYEPSGASGHFWNGYLDELRVSKGIARWTSNFTPPTNPYSASRLFFKSSSGEEFQL